MTTTRSFRKLGLATVLALSLTAAACGDDPTPVATSDDPAAPEVIRVAGVGGGGGRLSAESAAMADTSMIAPWYIADYVVGGELPAMPTEANGLQFASGVTADDASVRRIADALGVTGDLVEVSADLGGGWRIGPDDGSAPSIYVSADGQLSWWYSPAWADLGTRVATSCAVAEPALVDPAVVDPAPGDVAASPPAEEIAVDDPAVDPGCVDEIAPPVGVPSASEAEARAADLLAALGADASALTFETFADEWSASVSAYRSFDGIRSTVGYNFGFGENGRLEWASGILAEPVAVGPYPLVSVEVALERLRSGFHGWAQPAVLADAAADVAVDSLGAPEIDPAACAADGPDCFPEPEPITVTLVDVRMDLWMVWDLDGTVWLLPAFAFIADDGTIHTVPAVTDEYLVIDEPSEPVPGEPGVVEPAPGEPGVVEPGGSGSVPGEIPADSIPVVDAESLLGLSEAEATELAAANGWTVRVVARDGESFPVTEDFSPSRVNLTIDGEAVTAVSVG